MLKEKLPRHDPENSFKKKLHIWQVNFCGFSRFSRIANPQRGEFQKSVQRGNAQSLFLAQKSNQNTWFSATLVFSLVFRWLSAVSPTLCTVVSKKTKRSCFGGFFSLVFEIQALLGFLGDVCMLKQGPNINITFYINIIKI